MTLSVFGLKDVLLLPTLHADPLSLSSTIYFLVTNCFVYFFFHRCFSLFSALSASVNITNNANELVLLCNLKCISCAKGPPKKIATSQTQGIMADKD